MRKAILLSIRPKFAEKIFSGEKTVELRRVYPSIERDDLAIIYVSSPVKALYGAFKVSNIVKLPINDLWEQVKGKAGISVTEFYDYYKGKTTGVAIFFEEVWQLSVPLTLESIQKLWIGFRPPQSYCYVNSGYLKAGLNLLNRKVDRCK